jgi:hypothetical protein
MTTRSKGPGAGFGWLKSGFSVVFRHPKPLLGGAAFLVVACLLPALISLPMQLHAATAGTPLNPTTFLGIMAVSMLISLLLVPLQAGYLQLVDAAERGLPAHALDIFKPYRQGEALRLIGFGLAVIVVYVAIIGLIFVVTTGGGTADWYIQALAAQANHQPPPALPNGFGIAIALFIVLWLLIMGFLAISLGQVALGRRNVFGAIGDGLIGAAKNVLPLLVFGVSAILAWICVMIAFLLVAGLLTLLGKFVGAWLVLVLMAPLYIALLLGMFMVMFGTIYHLWRDVCGDDIVPDMAEAIAA